MTQQPKHRVKSEGLAVCYDCGDEPIRRKLIFDFAFDEITQTLSILQHFDGEKTGDLYTLSKKGLILTEPNGKKSRLINLVEFTEMIIDYIIEDEEL